MPRKSVPMTPAPKRTCQRPLPRPFQSKRTPLRSHPHHSLQCPPKTRNSMKIHFTTTKFHRKLLFFLRQRHLQPLRTQQHSPQRPKLSTHVKYQQISLKKSKKSKKHTPPPKGHSKFMLSVSMDLETIQREYIRAN